jgi:DinB family
MPRDVVPSQAWTAAWCTTHRATTYLIEHLPAAVWSSPVPGVPRFVDLNRVRQPELLRALERSSKGMICLIELAVSNGGRVPRATWQNFPTDVQHFLTYFAAHEAHHRGQLLLVARQLGHRLPMRVASGVWQWKMLAKEP